MSKDFASLREQMVDTQIAGRGVADAAVLRALRTVPRHLFVPEDLQRFAYTDEPVPIGEGQTISQPYIVAYMTEALGLAAGEKILEVGTGSGYQTAVLAEIGGDVYSVEMLESLSLRAQAVLRELGYRSIHIMVGVGSLGWKEFEPYDAIMVTAAPRSMPQALRAQLRDGGRMILPLGEEWQELVLVRRRGDAFSETKLLSVRFVPLVSLH